jgi:hypothetical protein
MAELSPYALQILDVLTRRDEVFAKAYDARPLFDQWDNYVRRVSAFNRYPDMTDHGYAHVNSVVALVAQLAVPPKGQPRRLNDSELFCLTAAAWLHDIGMYTTKEVDVFDPESIRLRHSEFSQDKMVNERDLIFPGLCESDVRIMASIAAYHQGRTALDREHAASLEKIAAEKALDKERKGEKPGKPWTLNENLPTLAKALEDQGWKHGVAHLDRLRPVPGAEPLQPVRVTLLAAILRVLDQSDVQMVRAGNLDTLIRRADRALRQRDFYARLLNAIPAGAPETDADKIRRRLEDEVDYFGRNHEYLLRDFWVERTFIDGNTIFVKMNGESQIRSQLALIPSSLEAATGRVLEAQKSPACYLKGTKKYILDELNVLNDDYLAPAGFSLKVEDSPSSPKERRALRSRLQSASPYVGPEGKKPDHFELRDDVEATLAQLKANHVRMLVLYGPEGRGRRLFARSLAETWLRSRGEADKSGLFWHVVTGAPLAPDMVRQAGEYLSSQGEYGLFNVVHEEALVTDRHVAYALDALAGGGFPGAIVLQDLNHVRPSSRGFLASLFRRFTDGLIIATTTRWPSADAANTYFSGIEECVRFTECPRLSTAFGTRLLERLARKAKMKGADATDWVDAYSRGWHEWGREGAYLDAVATNMWLSRLHAGALNGLVDAAVRTKLLVTWSRLSNREVEKSILTRLSQEPASALGGPRRFQAGPGDGPACELVDRDMARWERQPGVDPWLGDDNVVLQAARLSPTGAAWLHPGLARCLNGGRQSQDG